MKQKPKGNKLEDNYCMVVLWPVKPQNKRKRKNKDAEKAGIKSCAIINQYPTKGKARDNIHKCLRLG